MQATRINMCLLVGFLIVLITGLLSCEESLREVAEAGDYYPLGPDFRWEYEGKNSYGCRCDDSGKVIRLVRELKVHESLYHDGPAFIFTDERSWTDKVIRKLGTQYHELPAYSHQYMFLDATMPVGHRWITDSVNHNEFEITAVNIEKTIHGVSYHPVIEVKETRSDSQTGEVFSTTYCYYAKDVGLIYSTMKYGEEGAKSTKEIILLRYWKE